MTITDIEVIEHFLLTIRIFAFEVRILVHLLFTLNVLSWLRFHTILNFVLSLVVTSSILR